MSNEYKNETKSTEEKTWTEEFEVAGSQLVSKVRELVEESSVRRIIIRKPDGQELIEIPLAAGIAVSAASVLFLPVIAAIGAMAALVAEFKVEIVRTDAESSVEDADVQQIEVEEVIDSEA